MVERPLADLVAAAAQDDDVERVDLGLEQYVRALVERLFAAGLGEQSWGQRDLLRETLQGPVATALHLRGGAPGNGTIEPTS